MMNNPKKRRATASKADETKSDKLVALLRREGGASLAEITSSTGWLIHTARARLADLRKRGFKIDKAKTDDVTHYFIAAGSGA